MAKADFLSIGDVFKQGSSLWARRDYLRALGCFLRVIQQSKRKDWLARIATLTGEAFKVKILGEGKNPVLSPDGNWVAFVSQKGSAWKVLFVDGEGKNLQPLADINPGEDTQLQFSPDSKQLVFVSNLNSKNQIYLARLENKEVICIEEGEGAINGLVFSSDCRHITFSYYNFDVARSCLLDTESKTKIELKSPKKFNFSPIFLPQSKKILFLGGEVGLKELSLVIEDTEKGSQAILDIAEGVLPPLCCSPDGRYVAFISLQEGPYILNLDNKVKKRMNFAKGEDWFWSISFSEDSKELLFVLRRDDKDEIHLMDIDTMQTRTISSSRVLIDWVRFLPGGKRIICAGKHGRFTHKLSLINLDTGEVVPLDNDLPCATRTIVGYRDVSFSGDGKRIAYARDQNGDYRNPYRICLMDIEPLKPIDKQMLIARLNNLTGQERVGLKKTEFAFKAIDGMIRELTGQVSQDNLREYIQILQDFGPRPAGSEACNKAADFLYGKFAGWGLEVAYDDYQHQHYQDKLNLRNVVATLPGKTNSGITYFISGHYDSAQGSPGAWDDASGIAVVLETARILSAFKLGATIKFACFSAEELSLAGSKYFVGKIKEDGLDIRGVVHNDCIGYQRGERKEVTLFYSSAYLRDLLHSAAEVYSDLSSYSSAGPNISDDRSFVNALGDITVSIQDYPFLPSPYVHKAGDVSERLSFSLITEIAKLNVAALAALANCPSPVKGVRVGHPSENRLFITWQKNDEKDVCGYRIYHGLYPDIFNRVADAGQAENYYLEDIPEGKPYFITIKAYNKEGYESWGAEEFNVNRKQVISILP